MRSIHSRGIALAALLLAPALAAFTTFRADTEENALVQLLERSFASGDREFLVAYVRHGDNVLVDRDWGARHEAGDSETHVAADTASSLPAGGLAPAFIACAALDLAARDAMALDDEIGTHLKGLESSRGIRLRHLLTHTSGLPDIDLPVPGESERDALLAWVDGLALDNEPGVCAQPSAVNVVLAGLIVEQVGGAPLAEILARRVFAPAGMESTDFEGRAAPSRTALAGTDCDVTSALGWLGLDGLRCSVRDIANWQRALSARELFDEAGYRAFASGLVLRDGSTTSLSCGADLRSIGEAPGTAIGGSCGDVMIHAAEYPSEGLSIVLAGERDGLLALERRLARAALELADPEIVDLPLDAEAARAYEGSYYDGCNRIMILYRAQHLVASFEDREVELRQQGGQRFVARDDPGLWLVFDVEDGRARSFLLYEHGTQRQVVRLH